MCLSYGVKISTSYNQITAQPTCNHHIQINQEPKYCFLPQNTLITCSHVQINQDPFVIPISTSRWTSIWCMYNDICPNHKLIKNHIISEIISLSIKDHNPILKCQLHPKLQDLFEYHFWSFPSPTSFLIKIAYHEKLTIL
jgi:hypothetical protein